MASRIDVSLGTFVDAHVLADRFNLVAADVKGRDKIAAIVEQGVDFIDHIRGKLDNGWTLSSGNPYDWDVEFLTKQRAIDIAQSRVFKNDTDKALIEAAEKNTTFLDVSDAAKAKIDYIKSTFNLTSDTEAARLAVAAYAKLKDGLWRENGFYFTRNNGQERALFDQKRYMQGIK